MKETLKTWIDERECKWAQTRTLRVCCYRYAPEQFHAWRRESKGWKLISAINHDSTLGGMLICGNPEQCIQELKRMVRQEAKGGNGVTYGFFFADSRREYAFFRELYTFDLSLTSRLRLYKEIKREMEKNSWSAASSRTATLGDNYRIENVEVNARAIDPSRPCSIRVTDSTGKVVGPNDGVYVTDETGTFVVNDLEPGITVKVQETETVAGCELDGTPKDIVIKEASVQELTFRNRKLGTLVIKAQDSETKEPILGAEFKVTYANGQVVDNANGQLSSGGIYTTDENGEITIYGVTGTLVVTEEKTIPGYSINPNGSSKMVEVNTNDTQTLVFTNDPLQALTIQKFVTGTTTGIQGAVFLVTDSSGEVLGQDNGEFITDQHGRIVLDALKPGDTITVKEIRAAAGYALDNAPQSIKIKQGAAQKLTFFNAPLQSLTIYKYVEGTTTPLPGVTFLITDTNGNPVGGGNGQYVTDSNGKIVIEGLTPGMTVVAKEIKTVKGYVLNGTPQTIQISANGANTATAGTAAGQNTASGTQQGSGNALTFYDNPLSTLIIHKYVSGTKNEPLAGVTFLVTDSNGAFIGKNNGVYVTDRNGLITINELEPGQRLKVQETKTVEGYLLDGTPQEIEIQEASVHELTFWNQRQGSLRIRKLDSVTQQPLAGVEFKVTYSDGRNVDNNNGRQSTNGVYTTDAHGEILITGVTGTINVTETKTIPGYSMDPNTKSQTIEVNPDDAQTLVIYNDPLQSLTIQKYVKNSTTPLAGVAFLVTGSDGKIIGPNNGEYVTDANGRIVIRDLEPGLTVTVRETRTVEGFVLDDTPHSILIQKGEAQTMTLYNSPAGGLVIIKSDEETKERIPDVKFEVRKTNGELVGEYTTDRSGVIRLPQLEKGVYTVTERKAAAGYIADREPWTAEIRDGETTTLEITNRKTSNILIHKVDANTGKGIGGVVFLLYNSSKVPIGEFTSDNNGYVYLTEGLPDGRYYIRELKAADGYILDDELKTLDVQYGSTTMLTWKNTAMRGQIRIVKKSANDNTINGFPAGTVLAGAVFEVYDKVGTLVDTIKTDRNGVASTKLLPLSRYTIKEVQAPSYYLVNPTVMTAYLEQAGQIVSFEVLDESVSTGVSIKKAGYAEVMPGQSIRYTITQIANTSTVPLTSFYWRDTLPGQISPTQVITGSYNQQMSYKIVCKTTNSGSEYVTLADNLSTSKNYVLDAHPASLGLGANDRITEIMFVFGVVQPGFAQVETAYINGTVNNGLANESGIVNAADVGGVYNGEWIQGVSRWYTKVYVKPTTTTLPKTGY